MAALRAGLRASRLVALMAAPWVVGWAASTAVRLVIEWAALWVVVLVAAWAVH